MPSGNQIKIILTVSVSDCHTSSQNFFLTGKCFMFNFHISTLPCGVSIQKYDEAFVLVQDPTKMKCKCTKEKQLNMENNMCDE